jgi:hypothetical protein
MNPGNQVDFVPKWMWSVFHVAQGIVIGTTAGLLILMWLLVAALYRGAVHLNESVSASAEKL